MSQSHTVIPRYRNISKPNELAKAEARPRSLRPDGKDTTKSSRLLAPQKGTREQIARPRRPVTAEEKNKELREKLDSSEALVKDLQAQVSSLKTGLEKAQSLNVELQSQNRKLTEDLAAAQVRIEALERHQRPQVSVGEYQRPNFKDIQQLIANQLERPKVKREPTNEATAVRLTLARSISSFPGTSVSLPRPPPPPPPPRPSATAAATSKTPSARQFFLSQTKRDAKQDPPSAESPGKPGVISMHNSIVGEIQNRSAHLLAVKKDIETKGDMINRVIQKILAAAYTDIEDVLTFVDWFDGELASLADERAVLKHFKWPEKKADALREASIEYRDLKLLEIDISCYKDEPSFPCGVALKRMADLLDKSERSIEKLVKLRSSVMRSYQEHKIPIDWMLDSGVTCKIKQAAKELAKVYVKRLARGVESTRSSDRESAAEALLVQGMQFAGRAYQVAGGLDSETMEAFEEIRRQVPGKVGG